MEFKGTKGKWEFRHSEKNNSWKIIGTKLGYRYNIARCDYIQTADSFDKNSQKANALLISKAPELLDMLQLVVMDLEERGHAYGDVYTMSKELINKATTI